MAVKIPEAIQQKLSGTLRMMEETSELTRCVVVTRTGIKIAPDMDADSYSASSAALIDLGERVVASLDHGTLEELVINAIGGYVILVAVGQDYMLLGATPAAMKMGYYLPYLRKMAWELESVVYGTQGQGAGTEEGAEETKSFRGAEIGPGDEIKEEKPKISQEEIKAADIQAMNDVLAAFDEFGINDDFSKSLKQESAPLVSISKEEMSDINQQIKSVQESMPNLSTAIAGSTAPYSEKTEIAPSKGLQAGEYPIPLEPGEVPPIPLSPEELNPLGSEVTGVPAASVQPEIATRSPSFESVQEIEPDLEVVEEKTASSKTSPPPVKMTTIGMSDNPPLFEQASEYDFDFDDEKGVEKEVVIPEKDSMSETLKALGWEEEDGQDK